MSTLLCRFSAVLFLLILWIENIRGKEVRIVCYYTNWSVYRPGDAKFNPQNINPYLCTHLVYAFGGFTKENTLKPFDKYQDIEKGGYAKFVGLKTYNKNLKTLLAIGGWNEGSTRFSPMVASADRRKELVKNTIKFLRQNHFDGLDLDWEYPSFRDGGKTRDRDNYAQLVQELRVEFERESEKTGRPRLLLTMAVPAGIEYIKKGYDIPRLTKYLDWMNILSYDYHSAYEPAVNHHSPLYPMEEESEYSYDIDLNIDYTIQHYIEAGADKSKLVLGIPTYGRSYTLYNPDANEIGAPADGPGEMGEATRENGYLAYYEICENIKSENWLVESPFPGIMGPYAYKDTQWVSYDDADIARTKAEYVAENGLGGIMFWSIDNDDFRGKCGDRPYPIIEAAKEALLKAYGLSDSTLLATTKKPIKSRTRPRTRGTPKPTSTTEASVILNSGGRQGLRRKPHRISSSKSESKSPSRRRRPSTKKKTTPEITTTTVASSLLVTPSYTTPAPPSTPDTGGDFKCEDEGFFPHPRDCKKYFWCLSGPSELGIIAHQFTCPAGLYFNKAAASCDYTQNVLCNKKISKPSTTTTTTTTTTATTTTASKSSSLFLNRRPSPKVTAATSRTTLIVTPEPEYDEEYEYYDDEDQKDEKIAKDSEEDPLVIKELIELIRKAGGLEELEKQLKLQDDGSATVTTSGSTTETSISKTLFQRVLGKAKERENSNNTNLRYNTINRNSRGPQNQGISQETEKNTKSSNSRPQYTSILRSRPSTEAPVDESNEADNVEKTSEDDVEDDNTDDNLTSTKDRTTYRKYIPEYVTIRRQRISTTTVEVPAKEEEEQEGRSLSRSPFKQLGEDDLIEDTEENDKIVRNTLRSSTTPTPYVTIRRSRPTTTSTEETVQDSDDEFQIRKTSTESKNIISSTSSPEYITLNHQRPQVESDVTTSRYVEIRTRGTTTPSATTVSEASHTELPETTLRFRSTTPIPTTIPPTTPIAEKESTTTAKSEEKIISVNDVANKTDLQVEISNLVEENAVENSSNGITDNPIVGGSKEDNVKDNIKTVKQDDAITTVPPENLNTDETIENKGPQLFEPHPFSSNSRRSSTTSTTTTAETPTTQQISKVSLSPSTPRSLFRKNTFGSRESLLNRSKINKINDNANGNKENSVIDFEIKAQYDDDKNELVNRKRFRSVSSEDISDNLYEKDETSKEINDDSEYKRRLRNRGQSRYTLQTIGTTASPRPRIRIVTEDQDADYETTEYNRKYRPDISYEVADLSSLTAVDLKNSGLNRRNGFGRRRRPTPEVTETTSSTTTEKQDESLRTGARTLPFARKSLENISFGKNRRVRPSNFRVTPIPAKTNAPATNIEPQATEKRFISRLRRPLNRVEIQNSTSIQPNDTSTEASIRKVTPKIARFRKFTPPSEQSRNTNPTTAASAENISSIRRPGVTRRRKILKRVRTSTQRPSTTSPEPSTSPAYTTVSEPLVKSTENILPTSKASNVSEIEENLNINIITKTDLLNINENQTKADDLPVTISTSITYPNVAINLNETKENLDSRDKIEDDVNIVNETNKTDSLDDKTKDDLDSKSNEEDDEEEGENIKLSESNIRENSQIGNFQNGNVIRGFDKPNSKPITSYRSDLNNDKVDGIKFTRRPITEPNIIIRTRKIIRKLNPTQAPVKDDAANKKIRKVIRRFRPTISPLNQLDSAEKIRKNDTFGAGFLSKRRFGFNRGPTTTVATTTRDGNNQEIDEQLVETSKPLLSKTRYNSFNRKSVSELTGKSKLRGFRPEKGQINKSIYNRLKPTTTTTTTTTSTAAPTTTLSSTELSTVTEDDMKSTFDITDEATISFVDGSSTTESSTSENLDLTTIYESDYSSYTSTEDQNELVKVDSTQSTTISTESNNSFKTNDDTLNNEIRYGTQFDKEYSLSNIQNESMYSDIKEYGTSYVSKLDEPSDADNESSAISVRSTTLSSLNLFETNELIKGTTLMTTDGELSEGTSTDDLSAFYENTDQTDTITDIPPATTTSTTTTTTTRRTTPSTESALSRLLKRRRFGLSTSTTEPEKILRNEKDEFEKDQFSSLNSRLKLRKFGVSTTEEPLKVVNEYNTVRPTSDTAIETDSNFEKLPTEEPLKASTSYSENDAKDVFADLTTDKTQLPITTDKDIFSNDYATGSKTEIAEISSAYPIETETDSTETSYGNLVETKTETDFPENTILPDEMLMSSTENYLTEYFTEPTNAESDSTSDSTIEDIFKDTQYTTDSLLSTSTEESLSFDNENDSTINDSPTAKIATEFVTQDATHNDTDYTSENTTPITTTTTTTKRPNRLFRPIDSRPKYTVKYRTSENTSPTPSSASDVSTKTYNRYKFKSRTRNKFTFSSTTEKYDENEELGYGPVKEFKSILRVNSNLENKDEYYESKTIDNDDDEPEYEDEYENGYEEDGVKEIPNIRERPSLYNRPYPYRPVNPVLQKPSTFVINTDSEYEEYDENNEEINEEDAVSYDEDNVDDRLKSDEHEADIQKPVSYATRPSNAPYGIKSTTKAYKGFKSTTPAAVAQDLSDINITAINQRNRNLFNKTRKANTPVSTSANGSSKLRYNVPYYQGTAGLEANNISSYNTPYYQNNLPSSTEIVLENLANNTIPDSDTLENLTNDTEPDSHKATNTIGPSHFEDILTTEATALNSDKESTNSQSETLGTVALLSESNEDKNYTESSTELSQSSITTSEASIATSASSIATSEAYIAPSESYIATSESSIASSKSSLAISESSVALPTEAYASEGNIDNKETQINEKPTTLLHIFAETETPNAETTIMNYETDSSGVGNKKVEKLIEINRIIEVYSKEEFKKPTGVVGSKTVLKTEPILDKIGSVSRITEIKVVEDKNSTTDNTSNNSSPTESRREEKKYETRGQNDLNFNIPIVTSSDITQINQIHIDSHSAVDKLTPKPFYKIETATIPLEGLFQTESPLKYHRNIKSDSPNEILEGSNSRYVNVRVLEQDIADPNAKRNYNAKYIPVKILRDEEEITMKADVVEVTHGNRHQTIKIAPIKVSLERKVT